MNAGKGLYDPADERDSCAVGMVVRIDGSKGHDIVEYGLSTMENLAHRGAENADGRTGDGSGITLQIPHEFILKCRIPVSDDRKELKKILERHLRYTGSAIARSLLSDWENSCKRFIKVIPVGYKMLLKDESN